MPRRETRHSIERALAEQRRNWRAREGFDERKMMAAMERQMADMRKIMDQTQFAKVEAKFREAVRTLSEHMRRKRRRPGDGSVPALVEPPRGPKPLSGGAAVPLEFD